LDSDLPSDFENTVVGQPAAAPDFLHPGAVVGNDYILEDLLGRGGFGLVYRATHRLLQQTFALKILASNQLSEVNWQRFQREAQVLARLNHPNIVKIFNLGIDRDNYPYCVMELIDGESLDQLIERSGPLPIGETIECFLAVASALAAAHDNKIIHRDVKPANIMLCAGPARARTVKLVDFGLARVLTNDAGFATRTKINQRLTEVGEIFGSPLYMSPEQCMGAVVDHRTDIYSFGCSMFEALTGQVPIRGETALETFNMHINRAAPMLREKNADRIYSPELEAVLVRLLEKDPNRRYQSMASVMVDLQRVLDGKTVWRAPGLQSENKVNTQTEETPGVAFGPRKIFIAIACVALVAVAVVFGVTQFRPPPDKTLVVKKKAEEPFSPLDDVSKFNTLNGRVRPVAETIHYAPLQRVDVGNGMVAFTFDEKMTDAKISGNYGGDILQHTCGMVRVKVPAYFKFTAGMPPVEFLSEFGPRDLSYVTLQHIDNSEQWAELFTAVKDWRALTRLDFRNCRVKAPWIAPLDSLKYIDSLEFRDCLWQPQNIAGLKIFSRLKTFSLKLGAWGQDEANLSVPTLMDDLSHSPSLTKVILDFGRGSIDDASFKKLAALPHLESLELSGCRWSSERFALIGRMPHLRDLRIQKNEFSDEQLSALTTSKTLERIFVHTHKGAFDHKMPELRNASGNLIRFELMD